MIKKTITFKDLDGNVLTEDFYFALNTAEVAELEVSVDGGLSKLTEKLSQKPEGAEIMRIFKQIITMSVGKRSEDNRRFVKSKEISDDFMQTDAYPVLFMELCTDAEAGANFINGIIPADLADRVAAGKPATDIQLPEQPAWITEGRVPAPEELVGATSAQLQEAFRRQAERRPDTTVTTE